MSLICSLITLRYTKSQASNAVPVVSQKPLVIFIESVLREVIYISSSFIISESGSFSVAYCTMVRIAFSLGNLDH